MTSQYQKYRLNCGPRLRRLHLSSWENNKDDVDALVGVPSRVPPTTRVSCLFELLWRDGSQNFLSRFMESVSDYSAGLQSIRAFLMAQDWDPCCVDPHYVTTSSLSPEVIARPFSLALQTSYSVVKYTIRCWPHARSVSCGCGSWWRLLRSWDALRVSSAVLCFDWEGIRCRSEMPTCARLWK